MEMNTPSFHSSLSVLTTIIMNPLNSFHRSLLQDDNFATKTIGSPSPSFTSNSPFNSSLALTILVLLTVLFFMAFFSLYIRRFSNSSNLSGEGQRPPRLRTKSNGLDSDDVRKLPVVSYAGESKIWSECSICLSEFEEREFVKVIPYCRHGFHPVCIDTWLSSHVSCPLCRSTEFFLTVDEI